ncbi:helix-turn-helix domain-containing protein [Rhizobium etli]|uniref:AraC-like DNA-binding protein n=1 Tax=Rhizobium etli TaxID=29449 RepID=A0A7W6ZN95_RHIET|nr:AraC family transcriptional regulator [Rhizobium etli]MBB4483410.1 AraC-like DNA-binding protein [Rhizobium etli]MBB4539231.1 AraC-like DNA-binding protein [Rhizobium etli]
MGKTLLTGNQTSRGPAYGAHLAECFGLPAVPTHVHHTLQRGMLAVSELKSQAPPPDPNPSLGYDDAYQVIVQFKNIRRQLWLNGRFISSDTLRAGETYIVDLRHEPRVLLQNPWHNVNFYMPISTLKAYAEQNDLPVFAEVAQRPTVGQDDPVMRQLAGAASAAFAHPHQASGLLLEAILDAVCANVLGRYATSQSAAHVQSHGLAPWQERRAKELMDEHLDVSMSKLAEECGLSVAHFGRAFKRSTGIAPHQWQLGRRMKRAQALLTGSSLSIAEIALGCGFSSQSHFATAFRENTGVSPGRWRQLDLGGRSSKIDPDY